MPQAQTSISSLRKALAALDSASGRREAGIFRAEGTKCVLSLMDGFVLESLYATHEWVTEHSEQARCVMVIPRRDMSRLSQRPSPPDVIATFRLPDEITGNGQRSYDRKPIILALDDIQDPGNMGTMIRLAGWFGIDEILLSEATVDPFNPKVVQSTMGALACVRFRRGNLPEMLGGLNLPVYGAMLNGENIAEHPLQAPAVLVIGNEGHGISPEVERMVTRRITIPRFSDSPAVESLNAAMAATVIISQARLNE